MTPGEAIGGGGAPASDARDARLRWIEIVSAVLLSLATVGAAWAAYQSARWSGEQATATAGANAARLESSRAQTVGGQLAQIDVALFFQAVNAVADGDEEVAAFYTDRFREEFKPVFDAWVALDPTNNPAAPLSPFELDGYTVAPLEEAERLSEEAERLVSASRDARDNAESYTVSLVLLASTLFFAGIGTKFSSFRVRVWVLTLGTLLFLAVVVWLGSLPKSVAL